MNPRKSPPDERLPLYQRLRDEMLEKITLGEWHPDEAIPPESELTRTYGVAVGTVRKAVERWAKNPRRPCSGAGTGDTAGAGRCGTEAPDKSKSHPAGAHPGD